MGINSRSFARRCTTSEMGRDSHGCRVSAAVSAVPVLRATHDAASRAVLDELVPLQYERAAYDRHGCRRTCARRRRCGGSAHRLVIVQDDVNALAVRDAAAPCGPCCCPRDASGRRVFDDTLREQTRQARSRSVRDATRRPSRCFRLGLDAGARAARRVERRAAARRRRCERALSRSCAAPSPTARARLNIEGAVVRGRRLELFHRGNDCARCRRAPSNAIAELALDEFAAWLDGAGAPSARREVTTRRSRRRRGVPFGFTDAVALDAERVVVLACAEDSACAISDGAVLGAASGCSTSAACAWSTSTTRRASATRAEARRHRAPRRQRSASSTSSSTSIGRRAPAQLGRLVWEWR